MCLINDSDPVVVGCALLVDLQEASSNWARGGGRCYASSKGGGSQLLVFSLGHIWGIADWPSPSRLARMEREGGRAALVWLLGRFIRVLIWKPLCYFFMASWSHCLKVIIRSRMPDEIIWQGTPGPPRHLLPSTYVPGANPASRYAVWRVRCILTYKIVGCGIYCWVFSIKCHSSYVLLQSCSWYHLSFWYMGTRHPAIRSHCRQAKKTKDYRSM
jgi:hypothetical protein